MIIQCNKLKCSYLNGTHERYEKMFKYLFLRELFRLYIDENYFKHSKIEILKEESRD
jgi:hypothetical protein